MNHSKAQGDTAPVEFAKRQIPILGPTIQAGPPRTAAKDFAEAQATRGGHVDLLYVDGNIKPHLTGGVK